MGNDSAPPLRFGTTLHWAAALPDGYRVPTRPDIAVFVGFSPGDVLLPGVMGSGEHVHERVRAGLRRDGLEPRDSWNRFDGPLTDDGPVVLCTTSSMPAKDGPARLWDGLRARLGAGGIAHEAQTDGSLEALEAQLRRAGLVVAVDSGPMHLASYMGVPTLGVFFATKPAHFGPRGARDQAVIAPSPDTLYAQCMRMLPTSVKSAA